MKKSPKKVCGAIKAGNFMEMPGAPDLDIEMAKQELVRSVFSTQVTKEIDDIKQGITEILGVVETLNGKFKTELSDLKSDYQAFKNSPERKPVERKTDFKETFDDFRTEFLKQLRN